jgi:hypothetical protein
MELADHFDLGIELSEEIERLRGSFQVGRVTNVRRRDERMIGR